MKRKFANSFALVITFSLAAISTSPAADRTWDGGGADDNWNTTANWDAAIANTDSLIFDGNTRPTPVNNTTANNDYSITFNNGAGSFTLTGNDIDLISGGGITNNSANSQAVNLGVRFLENGTFSSNGGTLTIGGAITENGSSLKTLTVNGAGNVTISGAISANNGDLDITKSGSGTLTLSGNNSGYGSNTVAANAGTLLLDYTTQNNTKLNGSALVLSGATLTTSGGTFTENLGSVTLNAGASSITRSSGTATLQMNAISRDVGGTLDIGANNGDIATTDNDNVNGILGGWFTVAGSDWAAKVSNSNDAGIQAYTGYETSATIANWATSENISIGSNPSANLDTRTINSLKFTGNSTVTINSGQTLTVASGGIMATGTSSTNITGGSLKITGSAIDLVVHQNSSSGMTISSVIANTTGADGLTKTGTGILILDGSNTYTGLTSVTGGTLLANNTTGSATGTGSVRVSANSTLGGVGAIAPTGSNGISVSGVLSPGGIITGEFTLNLGGTTGTITMTSGSEFDYQLGLAGTTIAAFGTSDLLTIAGAGANDFAFNGNNIDFLNTGALGYYKLFDTSSNNANTWTGLTFDGTTGVISSGLTYSNLPGSLTGNFLVGTAANGGTAGDIYFHVVPEPSAALLGGIGLLILLRRRRSR